MRETEVRLDGWCEGGLRQWSNDSGSGASMRERLEWYITIIQHIFNY